MGMMFSGSHDLTPEEEKVEAITIEAHKKGWNGGIRECQEALMSIGLPQYLVVEIYELLQRKKFS